MWVGGWVDVDMWVGWCVLVHSFIRSYELNLIYTSMANYSEFRE